MAPVSHSDVLSTWSLAEELFGATAAPAAALDAHPVVPTKAALVRRGLTHLA